MLVFSAISTGCGDSFTGQRPAPGKRPPSGADGGNPDFARSDGGPRLPAADQEVVLPYMGDPISIDFVATADPGRLDVVFSMDTTGSFGGEIDNLQTALNTSVIPGLRTRVTDTAFAVSRFEDFPAPPYGAETDSPFRLMTPMTLIDDEVTAAVRALDAPLGFGGDLPESGAEALYQIATGVGYSKQGQAIIEEFRSRTPDAGGVGFRRGSYRVVVHITDASTHEPSDYGTDFPGTRTLDDATTALADVGAHVVGIASGSDALDYLTEAAVRTGASFETDDGTCSVGVLVDSECAYVFQVAADGSGLSDTIVDSIVSLVDGLAFDQVSIESDQNRLGFITQVEAVDAIVPDGSVEPGKVNSTLPGGIPDTFVDVAPGVELKFRVLLRNTTIKQTDYEQAYRITLRVQGDGIVLEESTIRVTIPELD